MGPWGSQVSQRRLPDKFQASEKTLSPKIVHDTQGESLLLQHFRVNLHQDEMPAVKEPQAEGQATGSQKLK